MSTNQWDEIKKLAADFQRTQLASSLQRLGDRNCVEIVKKLIELDLIRVIFTCDGKEYLTPEHLEKEIEEELILNGGRIELTQLVPILNVDLVHIEARSGDLVRSRVEDAERRISLVEGRLISREYKERLAEEINEKLSICGRVSVSDLTKIYDLPSSFIDKEVISPRLGSTIRGSRNRRDPKIVETDSFINSFRCRIRGVLSAITRPTALPSLVSRFNFPPATLSEIVRELIQENAIKGSVSGNAIRGSVSGTVFTPEIYLRCQQEWIQSFYTENKYIEFESLSRIGVCDWKGFLTNRFPDILLLKSCGVSREIVSRVESAVQECIINKDFLDLTSILPSSLSPPDLSFLLEKTNSCNNSLLFLADSFIVSTDFVDSLKSLFVDLMEEKAEMDLKRGKLFQVFASQVAVKEAVMEEEEKGRMGKKEERKKKVASKVNTGGGTQGREVKMKATKKKYNPREKKKIRDADSEDGVESSRQELVFMDLDQISSHLKEHQQDLRDSENDSLLEQISTLLYPFLESKYREVAKKVFDSASSQPDSSSKRKKTVAEFQSSLSTNHALIHFFSKGLEQVRDESLRRDLRKYLEKSLLTEVISSVISFLSNEENVNLSNPDSRINRLDPEVKEEVTILNSASVEDFNRVLEDVSIKCCNLVLKPIDKRREKVLLLEMKNNLIHQMKESDDLAFKLHLIVTSLFLALTGQPLHSSGKFVPQIIPLLKELKLKEQIMSKLTEAEKCLVSLIKKKKKEREENDDEKVRLEQLIQELEEHVENFKLDDDTQESV